MSDFKIVVNGVQDGGVIPAAFALCVPAEVGHVAMAPNRNPAVSWSGAPEGTRSFALLVVDSDARPCAAFLQELNAMLEACTSQPPQTLFRLAIEEVEAWYLGDMEAILAAYPRAKKSVLAKYQQDVPCGTWELLADAVRPGGAAQLRRTGWPLPGQVKHEWADAIGPRMDIERNASPSFRKLRDGLRRLVG